MEPEPGNPMEVEGVLNPAPFAARMASFTYFRGSSRRAIIRVSELHGSGLMRPAIRMASSGSVLRSSLKPTTNGCRTAVEAARTLVLLSWSLFSATL